MLRLTADENFNNDIVRGLRRRKPEIKIVRIQDVGLSGVDDPSLLEWCAREGRILLTHDVSTMTHHAYERVRAGLSMPGVFEVSRRIAVGDAIGRHHPSSRVQPRRGMGRSGALLAPALKIGNL